MPVVRMKDKGQVTIPAAVREQLAAAVGDMFDVSVCDGAILLKPLEVAPRGKSRPAGVDIARWIGAGRGSFSTPADVDAFIRAERSKWD